MLHPRDLGEGSDLALTAALLRGDGPAAEAALASGQLHGRRLKRVWDRHGLAGRVHRAAADLGLSEALPSDAADWARARSLELWATAQRQLAELERVEQRLAHLPWHAFVGGPTRSARVHRDAGRRLDPLLVALVPRAAAQSVVDLLWTDRWSRPDRSPLGLVQAVGEATVVQGHDVALELRWSVGCLPRRAVEQVARRATTFRSGGFELRAATLEDELLLAAVGAHAALGQGELDLGALDDLLSLARGLGPDGAWDERFAGWRELGADRVVTAALLLADGCLGGLGELPDLTEHLHRRRSDLGPLSERLRLPLLLPSGMDRRDRWAWAALGPTGPAGALRRTAARRARTTVVSAGSHAWEATTRAVRRRRDRRQVAQDWSTFELVTPSTPPPAQPGRIFVVIASYRDPDCATTIGDLFAKAAHPDRVTVGVCLQVDDRWDADCELTDVARPEQVRIWRVPADRSLGVCWARTQAQRLWAGEEHVLQVDSHSRFTERWDERMLEDLALCPSPKPYLTGYPRAFRLDRPLGDESLRPFGLAPLSFDDSGIVRTHATDLGPRPEVPEPTPFVAGGFCFSRADLLHEVPYDPYLAYDHEEVGLALRLFTHGWDGFVLRDALVFHLYGDDKPKDHRRRALGLHRQHELLYERAQARFDHLVGVRESTDPRVLQDLDRYGLGGHRTIEEFEDRSGIEFYTRTFRTSDEPALADQTADDPDLAEVVPLHRATHDTVRSGADARP